MATTTILPAVGGITTAGLSITVAHINPAVSSVTITGFAPVADITRFISPAVGGITAAGYGVYPMPLFADPIEVSTQTSQFIQAIVTGNPINVDFNIWWDSDVESERGFIKVSAGLSGAPLGATVVASSIDVAASLSATVLAGIVIESDPISVVTELEANWYIRSGRKNWVQWSKIGEASFVIDRTNEAGYKPMDWNGWAWQVKKLEENAIVYGSNGITIMYPVTEPAVTFGFKTLGKVGIKSPYSVAGSEFIHYFITSIGDLWRLTKKGPERLGFKEFLDPLTNPVLLYDEKEQRLFISDGSSGFIYKDGLGGGYSTITAVTDNYYGSAVSITDVPLSIMTDTIDLGHRGMKQITFVEVGSDSSTGLYVAVDFRYEKSEAWRTSSWVLANPEGAARLMIAGIEFRIRVKQTEYSETQIDYINVRHQRSDKRFLRGPLSEQPDQGVV